MCLVWPCMGSCGPRVWPRVALICPELTCVPRVAMHGIVWATRVARVALICNELPRFDSCGHAWHRVDHAWPRELLRFAPSYPMWHRVPYSLPRMASCTTWPSLRRDFTASLFVPSELVRRRVLGPWPYAFVPLGMMRIGFGPERDAGHDCDGA